MAGDVEEVLKLVEKVEVVEGSGAAKNSSEKTEVLREEVKRVEVKETDLSSWKLAQSITRSTQQHSS